LFLPGETRPDAFQADGDNATRRGQLGRPVPDRRTG
jgi:hypothetical protein